VRILLHGVSDTEQSFVQRIAIYLLNSLACQVDGNQKLFLGDLGAISVRFLLLLLVSCEANSSFSSIKQTNKQTDDVESDQRSAES